MEEDLVILGKLVLGAGLAAAIGWERERKHRPAGLRTHMLVGLSAVLFTALTGRLMERYGAGDSMQYDPIRLMEAIVGGISFLGAGTVFMSKGDDRVRGLTTAASILATGAIGVAVGLDRFMLAVGSTALCVGILWLVAYVAPSTPSSSGEEP